MIPMTDAMFRLRVTSVSSRGRMGNTRNHLAELIEPAATKDPNAVTVTVTFAVTTTLAALVTVRVKVVVVLSALVLAPTPLLATSTP
jgi:hypothetical protein